MRSLVSTVAAALAGAATMYYFDPDQGRRRRAQARDQWCAGANDANVYLARKRRHLVNRAHGLAARAQAALGDPPPHDDVQLIERVRSRIGRVTRHPGAIKVGVAEDGRVRLGGHALRSEVDALLAEVARVPGVKGVDNHLDVHDQPGKIPALQGGA